METIIQQIEEISLSDKMYAELTQKNMDALRALKKSMTEFLNTTSELLAYSEKMMYKSGVLSAHSSAQNVPNEIIDVMETCNKIRNATNS